MKNFLSSLLPGRATTEDVLVVQINPLVRQETPTSASEIVNCINEITFNSSLVGEYRAIDFFEMLHLNGKRAAQRFLDEHFADIGVKSTVDLRAEAQAEWA